MGKWILIVALTVGLMLGSVLSVGAATSPKYQPEDLKRIKAVLPDGAKYGYVFVGNGKWVIPPQFEDAAYSFSRESGLSSVKIDGKYGFIDLKGQIVIPPKFDKVGWLWAEGLMDVKVGDQTGFIDRKGRMVIGLQPGMISPFSEGLASVYIGNTTKFFDKNGTVALEVKGYCGGFHEGLARMEDPSRGRLAVGFMDRSGKVVIEPQAGLFMTFSFTEGRAPIRVVGGKFGFIDKSGAVVIPAQFDWVGWFREGLAPVLVGRKIGFIDLQGRMVLPVQYEYPDSSWQSMTALGHSLFHDGRATVKWDGKFGIIDKNGNWVVQPIYDSPSVNLYSRHNLVTAGDYYYDLAGNKLDHYVNHMQDGDKALKNGDPTGAAAFFWAALKINPGDAAAAWGLKQAEDQIK